MEPAYKRGTGTIDNPYVLSSEEEIDERLEKAMRARLEGPVLGVTKNSNDDDFMELGYGDEEHEFEIQDDDDPYKMAVDPIDEDAAKNDPNRYPENKIPAGWIDTTIPSNRQHILQLMKANPHPNVELFHTEYGLGLRAKTLIQAEDKFAIEYIGLKATVKEADRLSQRYDKVLTVKQDTSSKKTRIGDIMDTKNPNWGAFANDPRGSEREPNVEFAYAIEQTQRQRGHPNYLIYLEPIRDIQVGEEILVSYGEDYWAENELKDDRQNSNEEENSSWPTEKQLESGEPQSDRQKEIFLVLHAESEAYRQAEAKMFDRYRLLDDITYMYETVDKVLSPAAHIYWVQARGRLMDALYHFRIRDFISTEEGFEEPLSFEERLYYLRQKLFPDWEELYNQNLSESI